MAIQSPRAESFSVHARHSLAVNTTAFYMLKLDGLGSAVPRPMFGLTYTPQIHPIFNPTLSMGYGADWPEQSPEPLPPTFQDVGKTEMLYLYPVRVGLRVQYPLNTNLRPYTEMEVGRLFWAPKSRDDSALPWVIETPESHGVFSVGIGGEYALSRYNTLDISLRYQDILFHDMIFPGGEGQYTSSLELRIGYSWYLDRNRDLDGDGVLNVGDECPEEPEDRDGYRDWDGCPDPDNDQDGVPDERDECPDEREDHDLFMDDDGCPDYDNDEDGVPDSLDRCPDAAETFNDFQDRDGCPDEVRTIEAGKIGTDADTLNLQEVRILFDRRRFSSTETSTLNLLMQTQQDLIMEVLVSTLMFNEDFKVTLRSMTTPGNRTRGGRATLADTLGSYLVQSGISGDRINIEEMEAEEGSAGRGRRGGAPLHRRLEVIIHK